MPEEPADICPRKCYEAIKAVDSVCEKGMEMIPGFSFDPFQLNEDRHLVNIFCDGLFSLPAVVKAVIPAAIALPPMPVPDPAEDPAGFAMLTDILTATLSSAVGEDSDVEIIAINGIPVLGRRLQDAVHVDFNVISQVTCEDECDASDSTGAVEALTAAVEDLEEVVSTGELTEILKETTQEVISTYISENPDAEIPSSMTEMSSVVASDDFVVDTEAFEPPPPEAFDEVVPETFEAVEGAVQEDPEEFPEIVVPEEDDDDAPPDLSTLGSGAGVLTVSFTSMAILAAAVVAL
jgi:hypothetical protein